MIGLLGFNAHAQASYTKTTKPDGWKVPSVKKLEVLEEKTVDVEGYRITQVSYKIPDPAPYTLSPRRTKCEFRWLSTYSVAGEVFAVGGDCVQFSIDPRQGKFYFGGLGNFSFFDEDGDGKFETLISSGSAVIFVPPRLRGPMNLIAPDPIPPPPAKKPLRLISWA
jgi:hypothetical protein